MSLNNTANLSLQNVCVCVRSMHAQSCPTLQPHGPQSARVLCAWDFSGKNTGVGSCFLLQGIFPTQGSNQRLLCLLHWQVDSLRLESPGKSVYMCAREGMVTHSSILAWRIPWTEELVAKVYRVTKCWT